MKNMRLIIAACTLLVVSGANAQTIYDANRLIGSDLNGTARFVGMGGAMGALGGDISTISTNPAGIGIYRSNDAMVSFGFNRANSESKFDGNTMKDDRTQATFDNAGFVYSNKIGNKTSLRYVNFAFNYHRMKTFNKRMVMGGELGDGISQTNQMALQSDGLVPADFEGNRPWGTRDIGWLSILGWKGYLTDYDTDTKEFNGFLSSTYPYGDYKSKETGGINAYDFNVSFNFKDRVYLGFTLGAYDVNYSRYSYYREGFDYVEGVGDQSLYTLENWFNTSGAGVDFKVGAIFRPFANSPLRIGVAVHTPTFFNLKDRSSALLLSDIDVNKDGQIGRDELFEVDTYKSAGDGVTEYDLITPWKFNLSLGYTVGSSLAIGAEYEYMDYSTAKMKDYDGYKLVWQDGYEEKFLKAVHTARFGIEYKPISQFAVRFGYNHITAAIKDEAYKYIPWEGPNSIRTDTEYSNVKATNNYTVGMGYRGKMFYADIAYQYKAYKEDFYAFDNSLLAATKVNNDRHQVLMTLGVRF